MLILISHYPLATTAQRPSCSQLERGWSKASTFNSLVVFPEANSEVGLPISIDPSVVVFYVIALGRRWRVCTVSGFYEASIWSQIH